jgi:hypothetical protein
MPIGYDDQGVALRGPASESSQANTANILNNYTNINIGATINITKDWTVDADYTYANEGETTTRPGTRYSAGNTWAVPTKRLDEAGNRSMLMLPDNLSMHLLPELLLPMNLQILNIPVKGQIQTIFIVKNMEPNVVH